MEQARILQAMETANISSVSKLQRASYDARPTRVGAVEDAIVGDSPGCILRELALPAIAEFFDRSFVTASQVEHSLDLPVLVSIPQDRRQFVDVG